MLRQEVYALDGSDKAQVPYTVTEQNFTIERLQTRGKNRHSIFFTHPREGGRGNSTTGNVRGLSAHADKHAVEVCSTSGEGLCLCVNLAKVEVSGGHERACIQQSQLRVFERPGRMKSGTSMSRLAAVRRLVAFYVRQYNELMPHNALDFQTPDEVYFGRAQDLPCQLANARRSVREACVTVNRATSCETCRGSPASSAVLKEAA